MWPWKSPCVRMWKFYTKQKVSHTTSQESREKLPLPLKKSILLRQEFTASAAAYWPWNKHAKTTGVRRKPHRCTVVLTVKAASIPSKLGPSWAALVHSLVFHAVHLPVVCVICCSKTQNTTTINPWSRRIYYENGVHGRFSSDCST